MRVMSDKILTSEDATGKIEAVRKVLNDRINLSFILGSTSLICSITALAVALLK